MAAPDAALGGSTVQWPAAQPEPADAGTFLT